MDEAAEGRHAIDPRQRAQQDSQLYSRYPGDRATGHARGVDPNFHSDSIDGRNTLYSDFPVELKHQNIAAVLHPEPVTT
jgi:hypothetical protein